MSDSPEKKQPSAGGDDLLKQLDDFLGQYDDNPSDLLDQLISSPSKAALSAVPASDEATTPPATDEATTPPATDEATASPANDEATASPATDEATASPANDEATASPTPDDAQDPAHTALDPQEEIAPIDAQASDPEEDERPVAPGTPPPQNKHRETMQFGPEAAKRIQEELQQQLTPDEITATRPGATTAAFAVSDVHLPEAPGAEGSSSSQDALAQSSINPEDTLPVSGSSSISQDALARARSNINPEDTQSPSSSDVHLPEAPASEGSSSSQDALAQSSINPEETLPVAGSSSVSQDALPSESTPITASPAGGTAEFSAFSEPPAASPPTLETQAFSDEDTAKDPLHQATTQMESYGATKRSKKQTMLFGASFAQQLQEIDAQANPQTAEPPFSPDAHGEEEEIDHTLARTNASEVFSEEQATDTIGFVDEDEDEDGPKHTMQNLSPFSMSSEEAAAPPSAAPPRSGKQTVMFGEDLAQQLRELDTSSNAPDASQDEGDAVPSVLQTIHDIPQNPLLQETGAQHDLNASEEIDADSDAYLFGTTAKFQSFNVADDPATAQPTPIEPDPLGPNDPSELTAKNVPSAPTPAPPSVPAKPTPGRATVMFGEDLAQQLQQVAEAQDSGTQDPPYAASPEDTEQSSQPADALEETEQRATSPLAQAEHEEIDQRTAFFTQEVALEVRSASEAQENASSTKQENDDEATPAQTQHDTLGNEAATVKEEESLHRGTAEQAAFSASPAPSAFLMAPASESSGLFSEAPSESSGLFSEAPSARGPSPFSDSTAAADSPSQASLPEASALASPSPTAKTGRSTVMFGEELAEELQRVAEATATQEKPTDALPDGPATTLSYEADEKPDLGAPPSGVKVSVTQTEGIQDKRPTANSFLDALLPSQLEQQAQQSEQAEAEPDAAPPDAPDDPVMSTMGYGFLEESTPTQGMTGPPQSTAAFAPFSETPPEPESAQEMLATTENRLDISADSVLHQPGEARTTLNMTESEMQSVILEVERRTQANEQPLAQPTEPPPLAQPEQAQESTTSSPFGSSHPPPQDLKARIDEAEAAVLLNNYDKAIGIYIKLVREYPAEIRYAERLEELWALSRATTASGMDWETFTAEDPTAPTEDKPNLPLSWILGGLILFTILFSVAVYFIVRNS